VIRIVSSFLGGADTLGFCVAALLFLRAWRQTKDSLFASFAAAFALLALNQLLTVFVTLPEVEKSWIYVLRLAGFVLLIIAIIAKNLQTRTRWP
jgi:zinc transporter ZupT